ASGLPEIARHARTDRGPPSRAARSASPGRALHRERRANTKFLPTPRPPVAPAHVRRSCPRPSSRSHPAASRPPASSPRASPPPPPPPPPRRPGKPGSGPAPPRRARQLAGDNSAGIRRRLERAALYFASQRHEHLIARQGHAAADHHHFGIEDVDDVRDSRAE